jgi:hypothetical protein
MVARRPHTAAVLALALGCVLAASCSSTGARQEPAHGLPAGPAGDPALRVAIDRWDFGSIKRGETVTRAVALRNDGADAIDITAHSSCACLTAEPESLMLEPGESADLQLAFLGEDIKEKTTKTIYIQAGGPAAGRMRITVTGRVEPGAGPHLECLPAPLLFEKSEDLPRTATLRVANRGQADLAVTEMRCFGCDTSERAFTLGGSEEIEIEVGLVDGWTGSRWLEVVSNDPVQATRKISLVVLE